MMTASTGELAQILLAVPESLRKELDIGLDARTSVDEVGYSTVDPIAEDDLFTAIEELDRVDLCFAVYRFLQPGSLAAGVVQDAHLLAEAASHICRAGHNFILIEKDGICGGVFVEWGQRHTDRGRVVHAWAVDHRDYTRALRVQVVIDGRSEFSATTAPGLAPPVLNTGCKLVAGVDIRLEIDGIAGTAHLPALARAWRDESDRQELSAVIERMLAKARDTSDSISDHGTPLVSRRLDGTTEADIAKRNRVPGFIRYLASRFGQSDRVGTPSAAVSWVIGELLEDPERRRLFRLSAETESLFAEPAFSRRVATQEATLALFAFWRRHYMNIDIFNDVGLRRILYNFCTAPYMAEGNNRRMITPAMRERLALAASGIKGGEVAWSWYWVLQHEDRNDGAKLRDTTHARLLSLRETIADLLWPDRLSFSPTAWRGMWSTVDRRSDVTLSRFDIAMLAHATQESPAFAIAALGHDYCRTLLEGSVYAKLPELSVLSGIAENRTLRLVASSEAPTCDLAIIGHNNQTGLGRNLSMFAHALDVLNPTLFDADGGACINGTPPKGLRAKVVIICVNADRAPEVVARFASLCEGAHIIGFFLWETDRPPENHHLGTKVVDEIWCPTDYVVDAYRKITTVPVANVRKGLAVPPEMTPASRRWSRDPGTFTFLCLAEFGSGIIRKNPLDVIRAFEHAFPDIEDDTVRLVIKLREIAADHWSNQDGYWEEMEERIAVDPRIQVVVGDLSDDEYWALLREADVFVTLHRAEGFGYGAADALMCERGVIATDYSGTADFCDEETAYPVRYDLVPVPPQQLRSQGYIGNWAHPDIVHAGERMREARTDREGLKARGRQGNLRVRRLYDFEQWRRSLVDRISPYMGESARQEQAIRTAV